MATAVRTPDGLRLLCEWFAKCANTTEHATEHPVLGFVPICHRCAAVARITDLFEIELTVTTDNDDTPGRGSL